MINIILSAVYTTKFFLLVYLDLKASYLTKTLILISSYINNNNNLNKIHTFPTLNKIKIKIEKIEI